MKKIAEGYEICGAVYIGGRVIVTAAHCIDGPFWFRGIPCEDDGDCPELSVKLSGEVDVTCEESPINPTVMACVDTSANAGNQANNPYYVRFVELLALTTNEEIVVWPGDDADPWFGTSPTTVAATHSTVATGHSQMVVDDFDCDGHLDVVMPADDGGVIRYGSSMSLLGGGSYHVDMNGERAYELAVDDLDGDDQPDIVASTDAGEIYVLLGACGFDPYPSYAAYDFDPGGVPSPNPHLATVRMCGVMGTTPGIAVASDERIFVVCSDGEGDFSSVVEPHGEEDPEGLGMDYYWSADADAVPLTKDVGAIAAFGNHPELVVLAEHDIVRMSRSSCGYNTGWAQALSQPIWGGTQPLSDLQLVPSSNSANWRRVAVAGNLGWMLLQ